MNRLIKKESKVSKYKLNIFLTHRMGFTSLTNNPMLPNQEWKNGNLTVKRQRSVITIYDNNQMVGEYNISTSDNDSRLAEIQRFESDVAELVTRQQEKSVQQEERIDLRNMSTQEIIDKLRESLR